MDYDDFFGDDFIGKTTLDLDDRYFSDKWRSMDDKPIEYRNLYHETRTISSGVIKMFVTINEKHLELPTFNIRNSK
jgi:hypothetical protein